VVFGGPLLGDPDRKPRAPASAAHRAASAAPMILPARLPLHVDLFALPVARLGARTR
jgi:hypothetical protein